MMGLHISLRITEQRRANLDALAEIIHADGDAATIDFALGFTLAHLAPKESRVRQGARTVLLDCGHEVEWKEWGGPGQEDAPYLGHPAWCNECQADAIVVSI